MWWLNKKVTEDQLTIGNGFDPIFQIAVPNKKIFFLTKKGKLEYTTDNRYLGGLYFYNNDKIQSRIDNNDEIFKILNLNKRDFAKKAYGYDPESISSDPETPFWPECRVDDYEALGRIIYYLKQECQKQLNNVVAK